MQKRSATIKKPVEPVERCLDLVLSDHFLALKQEIVSLKSDLETASKFNTYLQTMISAKAWLNYKVVHDQLRDLPTTEVAAKAIEDEIEYRQQLVEYTRKQLEEATDAEPINKKIKTETQMIAGLKGLLGFGTFVVGRPWIEMKDCAQQTVVLEKGE